MYARIGERTRKFFEDLGYIIYLNREGKPLVIGRDAPRMDIRNTNKQCVSAINGTELLTLSFEEQTQHIEPILDRLVISDLQKESVISVEPQVCENANPVIKIKYSNLSNDDRLGIRIELYEDGTIKVFSSRECCYYYYSSHGDTNVNAAGLVSYLNLTDTRLIPIIKYYSANHSIELSKTASQLYAIYSSNHCKKEM